MVCSGKKGIAKKCHKSKCGAAAIKEKYPTIDIVKLNGKEIDILLRMCVPTDARIGIISKPVAERREKHPEKNISNIKIWVCLEEIQTQVSKLNQLLE